VESALAEVERAPRSAQAWGDLGDRLLVEGWLAEAASCYAAAERFDPAAFVWPYRRALASRLDDPASAAAAVERALAIDDGYAPAWVRLGRLETAAGHTDEALAAFRRALELAPGSAAAHLGLGQLALASDRLEEARRQLAQALSLDPTDGRAHLAMSQVALASGDAEAARRHGELARRNLRNLPLDDPRGMPAVESVSTAEMTRRGRELLAAGRVADAESLLRQAVENDPDADLAHLALGLTLVLQRRPDDAETELRRAVELAPDRVEARLALGRFLLLERRDPARAEPQLAAALALAPDDAALARLLAEVRRTLDREP
jgi:tetratricopeptide (TPR) repeat protein